MAAIFSLLTSLFSLLFYTFARTKTTKQWKTDMKTPS